MNDKDDDIATQLETADPFVCFDCKMPLTEDEYIVRWKACRKCSVPELSDDIWIDIVAMQRERHKEE